MAKISDDEIKELSTIIDRGARGSYVLSQDEIDELLTPISVADAKRRAFKNIEAVETYLVKRKFPIEKHYGIFDNDVEVDRLSYSGTIDGEKILSEIKKKNEDNGFGNTKIPNTNITLINFSFCPKCKTIYSFNDVTNYYNNPKTDTTYKSRAMQFREDTRICCNVCDTYFLPTLIISDGTPKNEVQFLCRCQTINAIEEHFLKDNIKVLTRKKENIVEKEGIRGIKNDVYLKDLEKTPTLITNMLQYTPVKLIKNLIDGTNVKKGDFLFNGWWR